MREIKFRAWRTDIKRMLHIGDATDTNEGKRIHLELGKDDGWAMVCAEYNFVMANKSDAVLMQYTGLKDKKGKEIYEGDIVRISFQEDNPAGAQGDKWYTEVTTVEWADGYAGFNPFCYRTHYQNNANLLEVIGNIYENKKLIK